MRQKLTVLIPCKDEQHNIRACIDSVGKLADEILVADSGSTDNTLQICGDLCRERPTIRIIEREYLNPSSFKNWAIPQATHSWVLALDADERVTPFGWRFSNSASGEKIRLRFFYGEESCSLSEFQNRDLDALQ